MNGIVMTAYMKQELQSKLTDNFLKFKKGKYYEIEQILGRFEADCQR